MAYTVKYSFLSGQQPIKYLVPFQNYSPKFRILEYLLRNAEF